MRRRIVGPASGYHPKTEWRRARARFGRRSGSSDRIVVRMLKGLEEQLLFVGYLGQAHGPSRWRCMDRRQAECRLQWTAIEGAYTSNWRRTLILDCRQGGRARVTVACELSPGIPSSFVLRPSKGLERCFEAERVGVVGRCEAMAVLVGEPASSLDEQLDNKQMIVGRCTIFYRRENTRASDSLCDLSDSFSSRGLLTSAEGCCRLCLFGRSQRQDRAAPFIFSN